jgi:hypothetical protein
LKIHNTRVHTKIDFKNFPAACDVCGNVFENENQLKKHKKREHTYHTVQFQCNECEFMANEVETLNVHFGRKHTNKKQCGLCDKTFRSTKDQTSTICGILQIICKAHLEKSHSAGIF